MLVMAGNIWYNSSKNSMRKDIRVMADTIVKIYTDGACSGNPGPGGWGAVLLYGEHEKQLSGGERRRTEIARCLAIDPKFIMLDEPFAGVDPIAVEDIQFIVWKLKDRNIGILITDHNVEETLCITERAYLLFDGRILFKGTPEELAANQTVRDKYLTNSFKLRKKDFQLMEQRRDHGAVS